MKRVKSIRVSARLTLDGIAETVAVATFELGLGPCGQRVIELRAEYRSAFLLVVQHHDDGSVAEFAYPIEQLTGRVEIQRG